jgi:hypothetical protein
MQADYLRYASEPIMAALLLVASIILVIYTRNKTKDLPAEETKLGTPLYLSAIAVFLLGIASFVNYVINTGIWVVDPLLTYYQLSIIAPGILTIAGLMILGWNRYHPIPIIMMIVALAIAFLFPVLGVTVSPQIFIGIINLTLYALPIGLFGYLTIKQKRLTSFSLFMIVVTFLLFPFTAITEDQLVIGLILLLRFIGPAIAIVAFNKTDVGISLELGGYAIGILAFAMFLTLFQTSAIFLAFVEIELITVVIIIAVAAALGVIAGTYTLGRWKISRSQSTFLLGIYLLIAGVAFLLVALNNIGTFGFAIEWEYIVMILSILVLIPLNLSAFSALEWNKALLIPFIIAIPPVLLLALNYPTPVDDIAFRNVLMAITGILQNVIPMALFGTLWWRMRKAEAPGRSRPLFLAIGIVLLLVAAGRGGSLLTYSGGILLFMAFILWLLAVTGYADKLLKTAGE